jgi:hypothetical protein
MKIPVKKGEPRGGKPRRYGHIYDAHRRQVDTMTANHEPNQHHQLIAKKWIIGKQIASQPGFRRGSPSMIRPMAEKLGMGLRDAQNCVRFYEQFPELALDENLEGLQSLMQEGRTLTWSRIRHLYLDKIKPYRSLLRVAAQRLSAGQIGKEWRECDHARLMGLIGFDR